MHHEPLPHAPSVVSEKSYKFVPPKNSRFWPWLLGFWLPGYLRKSYAIASWEVKGLEHMQASLKAGHGIFIVPNHPRTSDAMALGFLTKALGQNFHVMASAHLFLQSRVNSWLLPRVGAFSVYREGMDRESLKMATDILANARRPLVVFAEGVVTRTNDRLIHLQDGTAFIARSAAKQRAEKVPGGKVVVHPLALRYVFQGNLERELSPVLDRIESRLSWQPQRGAALHARIVKLGHALLALKEIEYFGAASDGPVPERLARLLDQVLLPLETEWIKGKNEGTIVVRIKNLRKAILPDLIAGEVTEAERAHRWKCLYDLEVAQQIFHFPPDYLGENPPPERLIETVARYEEALGAAEPTSVGPMLLRFEFGPAITVDPMRDRKNPTDPLMDAIRGSLTSMLGISPD